MYAQMILKPKCRAKQEHCQRLDLKGRILLAAEGINGSVAGNIAAADAYIEAINTHRGFAGIAYKRCVTQSNPFPGCGLR